MCLKLTINNKLEGNMQHCYGIDYTKEDDRNDLSENIPIEYLNSLTPNGLPTFDLQLKKGAIVILIRNLNIQKGLCNGTRLKITNIQSHVLSAKIISGVKKGTMVMLPRIDLDSSEEDVPFIFTRQQVPIRLGYSITINKAQG